MYQNKKSIKTKSNSHYPIENKSRRNAIKILSTGSVFVIYGCGGAEAINSTLPTPINGTSLNNASAPGTVSTASLATNNPINSPNNALNNDSSKSPPNASEPSTENTAQAEVQSSANGVTLISPPRVIAFNGNISIAGAILKVVPATWLNEVPVERSGIVNAYTSKQISLDDGASNKNDIYKGMWIVVMTGNDFAQPCGIITAYDGNSKTATIDLWRDGEPILGKEWKILNHYPIQRKWQWRRNGTPIEGQNSATYTTQDIDAGKSITATETAGFIEPSNNGQTAATPASTATAISNAVTVSRPTTNAKLIQQDDFEYQGSFRLPDAGVGNQSLPFYSDAAFFVRHTGGISTAIVRGHTYTSCVAEVSLNITPSKTGLYSNLPIAPLVKPNGSMPLPLLSSAVNLSRAGTSRGNSSLIGVHGIPDGRILFNYTGGYNKGPWVHFRRATEISDQTETSVEGPFTITDPNYQTNTRWTTGWYCDIPSEWQASLGGDIIAGSGVPYISFSVNALLSHGPSAIVFSSNSIDPALATKTSGTARGGSSSPASIQFAESASAIDGFYVGQYLNVPDCFSTAQVITAYNGSSKTATVEKWDTVPAVGTVYNTIPNVAGRQLIGYPSTNGLEVGNIYGQSYPIWNFSTAIGGMCVPNGTDSLLIFCKTGDGLFTYAQAAIAGETGIQRAGFRIYDPGNSEPGPHTQSCFLKVYAYDVNELVEVKDRKKTFSDVKPHGIFTLNLPSGLTSMSRRTIRGVSYDKAKRQVLVAESCGPAESPIIHVFSVKRAT